LIPHNDCQESPSLWQILEQKGAICVSKTAKTLEDIEKLPKTMLLATDVSPYLETDPGLIRWQAQREPEKLGFPVIVIGSRVKIPKDGFVFYCKFGRPILEKAVGED